jgi:hypothetical protein
MPCACAMAVGPTKGPALFSVHDQARGAACYRAIDLVLWPQVANAVRLLSPCISEDNWTWGGHEESGEIDPTANLTLFGLDVRLASSAIQTRRGWGHATVCRCCAANAEIAKAISATWLTPNAPATARAGSSPDPAFPAPTSRCRNGRCRNPLRPPGSRRSRHENKARAPQAHAAAGR